MNLFNNIKNYIGENNFRMIIYKDKIDIINYDDIINVSNNEIIVKSSSIITINGKNLKLNKMLNDEILVIGDLINIKFNE